MNLPAEVGASPQFLPAEVVAIKAVRRERNDDALAVGHGRSGAIRVGRVGRFLFPRRDAGLPEQLAVRAIQAHERATVADGLGDEEAIAPDNRRGITRLRQWS